MKIWIRNLGQVRFQIFHALIWAGAIVLIDWISDRFGAGVSYSFWLVAGYFLANGAITAAIFAKSETE